MLGQHVLLAATPVTLTTGTTMEGYGPGTTGSATPMDGTWQAGGEFPISGGDLAAGGFTVDINSGGPLVAFCAELGQPVTLDYDYFGVLEPMFQQDAVAALGGSTAGSGRGTGIAIGGIGSEKAKYLQILFDQSYLGNALTDWSQQEAAAFQLALWKLTHEAATPPSPQSLDLGGSYGSGAHFGYNGDATVPSGLYDAANTLVGSVLGAVGSYVGPTKWELIALTNTTEQDLITATLLIPEPQTWALVSGLGLMLLVGVRRWRHGRSAD